IVERNDGQLNNFLSIGDSVIDRRNFYLSKILATGNSQGTFILNFVQLDRIVVGLNRILNSNRTYGPGSTDIYPDLRCAFTFPNSCFALLKVYKFGTVIQRRFVCVARTPCKDHPRYRKSAEVK